MKNNISYYQHYADSDQHPKFKMLRVKYGWAGEGRFWALNNRIAQADNCILDLEKGYNKISVASDLGFTIDEFEEFISFLALECGLIMEQGNMITTEIVQEIHERVNKERKRNKDNYKLRIQQKLNGASTNVKQVESKNKHVETIQSKVKESKVKEKKKVKKKFSPPTLEEVNSYIKEKDLKPEGEKFIDYYTSNGWKVGKNPMKDWKATIRNWNRNDKAESKKPYIKPSSFPRPGMNFKKGDKSCTCLKPSTDQILR